MLHHIAVFTWTPETTAEQVAALQEALAELGAGVPTVRSYAYGPDLGLSAAPGDFAVAAAFDDVDGWRTYDAHELHQAVRADHLSKMIATRTVVQFES